MTEQQISVHNSVHEGIKTIHFETQENPESHDNKINLKTENETSFHKPPEEGAIKPVLATGEGEESFKPSITRAIFTMTSLSIGTGCLTFTKKAIQVGFLWFAVLLIVSGAAIYWTLCGMIRVARKKGDWEYSSTVLKILGKSPAVLVDAMTSLYSLGIIIAFELIINTLTGRVIYTFFKDKDKYPTFAVYNKEEWDTIKIKALVLVILTILLLPLCLAKDIGKMKFFGYFSIITLAYTVVVLIIECPFFWSHYKKNVYVKEDKSTHPNWFDITNAFNSNLDFCTAFCTILYSYSNHQGAFPLTRTLHTNDDKVMNKVFGLSTLLTMTIYFVIFVSSFLTSPLESEDLIIFRDSIFSNDIFMNIAKIATIIELLFLLPCNYNSMRCASFHLMFGNEDVRTIPNIIFTSVTLILTAFIGAVYSNILNYLSLFGGFCCTTICFLIPGWMMIKVEWEEMSKVCKILTIIGITILCIIGYVGGIESVILFFK